jgi:hypothetical protein
MGWVRYLWLAVPLLALAELGGHLFFAGRAPTIEEWNAIRAPVSELRAHDEPVVVAPYWAEPLARHVLGNELMPVRDVARPDPSGYERVVEVSILGDEAEELAGWRTLEQREFGAFRLRVRQNPEPVRVRFDFVTGLGPERVRVFDGAGLDCWWTTDGTGVTGGLHGHIAFPAARFQCLGGRHFFVGQTVVDDQDYRPRRCIWAHPPRRGSLRIRYRDVPLGSVVRGYAALSWFLWRDGGGTPVELRVQVDGDLIGTLVHTDEQGWNRFQFATGRHAGKTADVEFLVRSDAAKDRHFCFYADTR